MSGSTSSNNIIGSGSDSIVVTVAEDQAENQDATFTVNVDGQQIGGPQTVTALHDSGQSESFTFEGNYGPGQHNVVVTYNNNLIWPGDPGDRNLYVEGVTYDGQTVSNSTTAIYNSPLYPPTSTSGPVYGNATYSVTDTTSIPAGAGPNPTTSPGSVSVGSGSDNLVLNIAEDPYLGDAQFTITVDGQQIGGTQTATAVSNYGQTQEFDLHGNFGGGTHTVSVTFLNDQIGGVFPGTSWAIDTEDRNLYVMGASLDGGTPASNLPRELSNDGSLSFSVTAGSNSSATASSSGLFAADGAAATSGNAAITSSSLSTGTTSGSTSGMTFLAPTTTGTTSTDTSTSGSTGSGSTGVDSTTAVTTATTTATQTTQDFTVPSTTSSSSSDTTSSSGGNWWSTHQHSDGGGYYHHHS